MTSARPRPDLESFGLDIAFTASLRSEDPYFQVGSCIMRRDGAILSVGYNGPPAGIEIDWSDRDARRLRVIHAEANALRYIQPHDAYMILSTHLPCLECMKLIRAYGISRVVYANGLDPDVYDTDLIIAIALEFGLDVIKR